MINWLKYRKIYFSLSALLVAVSLFYLFANGLRPGIDFTGGTLLELLAENRADAAEVEEFIVKQDIELNSIQESEGRELILRMEYLPQDKNDSLRSALQKELPEYEILRFETVGPTLGAELLRKTLTAAVLAVAGMLFYIAWAFRNLRFGIAAVLALLHDTLILVGSFSLLGRYLGVEVDALFVTAVLTTMSFSVHDTVVVFNKIKEKGKSAKAEDFTAQANNALTETMVRSINNSLTILFMLLALVLLGGETIRWFMAALAIGTVLGTYSSPFVAVPLLQILQRK